MAFWWQTPPGLTARCDEYVVGIREEKTTPLFRTAHKKTGTLTENRITQPDAWDMLPAAGEESWDHDRDL